MYILKEGQPIITPEVQTIINYFKDQFSQLFLAEVNKCKRIIQSKEGYLKKKTKDAAKKTIVDIAASTTEKSLPGVIKSVTSMVTPGQVPDSATNAIGSLAGGAIKFGAYFAFYLQGKGKEKKIESAERFLENIKALGGKEELVRNVCDYLIKRFIYVLQDIAKTTSKLSNVEILTKCLVGSLIEILLPDYKPIGLSIIDKLRGKNQPDISLEYVLDQIVPKEGRVQFREFLGKFNIKLNAAPFDETYTLEGLLHRSPVLTSSSDAWVKGEEDQSGKYPFQCMSESDAEKLGYHLARPKLGIPTPIIGRKAQPNIQELANSIEQFFKIKSKSYKFENNAIEVIQKMRQSRKELVREIETYKINNKIPDISLLKKLSKYTKHLFTYYFYNLLNPQSEEKYFLDARENSFLSKEYDWIDSISKACQVVQVDEKKRKEFEQDKSVIKFAEIVTYLEQLKTFSSLKTERYFPNQDIPVNTQETQLKESENQNEVLDYRTEIIDLINQCNSLRLINENPQEIIKDLKIRLDILTKELERLNNIRKSPTEDNIEAKENYKDEVKTVKELLLFGSIAIGDKSFIETLLANNIIAWDDRNHLGYTALHQAAFFGNETVFNLLLEKALKDKTQKDFLNTVKATKDDSTILHSAAFGGSFKFIPLIVTKGVKPNEKNSQIKNSSTALHVAAFSKHPDKLAVIKTLVENGANVTETDAYGNTPLHLLCEPGALVTREMFEFFLLNEGANPSATNSKNQTPLQYAHSFKRAAQMRLEKTLSKQQSSDETKEGKKEESEVDNSNSKNLQKLQNAFEQAKNIVELLESVTPKFQEVVTQEPPKEDKGKCLTM